ncbi:MAG: hypothetical protein KDB27_30045 [Planctomycetales bacterium]|nr:hypothetical protein [Planctomycetales bacterium]
MAKEIKNRNREKSQASARRAGSFFLALVGIGDEGWEVISEPEVAPSTAAKEVLHRLSMISANNPGDILIVRVQVDPLNYVPNNREIGSVDKSLRNSVPQIISGSVPVGMELVKRQVPDVWDVRVSGLFIPFPDVGRLSSSNVSDTLTISSDTSGENWYEYLSSEAGGQLLTAIARDGGHLGEHDSQCKQGDPRNARGEITRFEAAVDTFLGALTGDWKDVTDAIGAASGVLRDKAANRVEPVLNEYVRLQPQDSLEQKRALASLINERLQALGLAIRCPITNAPAIIVADQRSDSPNISRFRLRARKPGGGRTTHGVWRELPPLELMPDSGRVEPFAKWTQKIRDVSKQSSSGKKH